MAIKTPKWIPAHAYPSPQGWITSRGEILKKQRFTAEEIAEWFGTAVAPVATAAPAVQMLTEAPSVQSELSQETIAHYYYSTQAEETSAQDTDEDM